MITAQVRLPASRPYGRATPLLSGSSTVWERNLKHLVTTIEELHDRGVGLRVLTGAEIDTTTANSRLVFGIFAAMAEFERELITERTRARGRMSGRHLKMDVAMLCLAKHAMNAGVVAGGGCVCP